MSMETYAIFTGEMPSVADFEAEMKRIGFPVALDKDVTSLEESEGFQPMTWGEEETGVEMDLWLRSDDEEFFEDVDVSPDLDRVCVFRWGGDETEMLCGLFGVAAIAGLTGGTVYDGESGEIMDAKGAAELAVRVKKELNL
ncbi:MAG: hypothetical protein AB7O39_01465 [Flavobacteriaceae bacterium]